MSRNAFRENDGVTWRMQLITFYGRIDFSHVEDQREDVLITSGMYCMRGDGTRKKNFICHDALGLSELFHMTTAEHFAVVWVKRTGEFV